MLLSFLVSASLLGAALPDSLQAATVVADRGLVVSRTDTLTVEPFQDVTAALQRLPGLYVGDYGSLSGLKSVSLRGFGSAHTAIYIDGLRVGNVQSGQNDLGMLDLESVGSVVADYAQNSLHFVSASPLFGEAPVSGLVRLGAGSFGTFLPYARINYRLNPAWSLSAHAGGAISKGDFPLEDGTLRTNNDIQQLKAGLDLFGLIEGGDFHAKVAFNGAERGTPGSLAYPSADDRQRDRNIFGQFLLRKTLSSLYSLELSGKTSFDNLFYHSAWGDTDYEQTEFQLNSVHRFRIRPWWELSLAADVALDNLSSDMYHDMRLGVVGALASAFRWERFRANVALEYSLTSDQGAASWNRLSPSVDVRYTLCEGLSVVAFGRRAYRIPTFNDLYYPGAGNPDLQAEDGWLTDLGLDWRHALGSSWVLKARADGFFNALSNKIIWGPTAVDPMIWLPFNIGKVHAYGADLMAQADYAAGDWKASFALRYGLQKALDKTPDSYTFDQQIPFVARHTLSAECSAAWRGWNLAALWNLRAGRWDSAGEIPDCNTLDVTFSKEFPLGVCRLGLNASARNLLDKRYELVSGYPVPGRNFLGGITLAF